MSRTPRRGTLALAALSALALLALLVGPSPTAGAAPTSAPAGSATVHPGVQTFTGGGQCTANFVFSDGTDLYLGQAAHCSSGGAATDTDGCSTASAPLGTEVEIAGAEFPGTLAYNSWLTMQQVGETDPNACAFNDLALVRIDPRDHDRVNPSIPHWGGPTGLNTTGTTNLETVRSYGNSSLRGGVTLLSPKLGVSTGTQGGGWTHVVNTVTPGIPGDSGSAFLDSQGRALGVLSTLGVGLPGGVVNNVSDLARGLSYLRQHATGPVASAELVLGTEPFAPTQLPLDLDDPVDDPAGALCGLLGC
jgi:hypothetical protein